MPEASPAAICNSIECNINIILYVSLYKFIFIGYKEVHARPKLVYYKPFFKKN